MDEDRDGTPVVLQLDERTVEAGLLFILNAEPNQALDPIFDLPEAGGLRAGAHTVEADASHVAMIARPAATAALIERAAR